MRAGRGAPARGVISALRRTAARALRLLDEAVSRRSGVLRVVVDVRTPMNLAVLRPVWRVLADDPRIVLTVTAEDMAGVGAALASDSPALPLVRPETLEWKRVDLVMVADAWNHAPLRRCRRSINFFHGVAGKYDLDDPAKLVRADFDTFDRLAFINRDRMTRYLASGIIRPEQAVLVGFPKIDALLNGQWSSGAVRDSLSLSSSVPTVLYAPTFSTANSLQLAGEAIIAALLGAGRNVIVKLHDRSAAPDPRYTAGIDWPARLADAFGSNPRFVLARSGDISPLLAAADVLVTDHSTVGFEFALLDRPIVVYDTPGLRAAARIDEGKWELLRSMADVVATPGQLVRAVDTVVAAPERKRDARRAAHGLFANAGRATDVALDVVYELLELGRPVGQGRRTRAAGVAA